MIAGPGSPGREAATSVVLSAGSVENLVASPIMSRLTHVLTLLVTALLALPLIGQTTLNVPAAFSTIQSAIAAASPGDTVLVAPGVYVENVDFQGKAITVRSSNGPGVTVIDGNQAGPVVSFVTNETQASVIDGFTITNGLGQVLGLPTFSSSGGGGIHCAFASPTIRRCVVTGNIGGPGGTSIVGTASAGLGGGPGGISAVASSLRLVDCDVVNNLGGNGNGGVCGTSAGGALGATGGWGGPGGAAISLNAAGGTPEIMRCRFIGNVGGNGGAALCPPGLGGAGASGGRGGVGGLQLSTSTALVLSRVVVASNLGGNGGTASGPPNGGTPGAGGAGGIEAQTAIFIGVVPLTFASCAILNNVGGNAAFTTLAGLGGIGGGAVNAMFFTAVSTTVAGNVTGIPASTPIFGNAVTGGLAAGSALGSLTSLQNCIFWGNATNSGLPSDLAANGTATSCDIGSSSGTITGTGNISTDPLFVNLAAGDVHLSAASPCRHSGTLVSGLPLFDYEGDPRTVGPGTDIGADEYDDLVGSREDFALSLSVNGGFAPAVNPSLAPAGSSVTVAVVSPGGTLSNDIAFIAGELWTPPFAPIGPASFPEVRLSPFAVVLAFYSGIGPTGGTLSGVVPVGLAGLSLRVQSFCVTPAARNGIFASTAAREVSF